jgi:hypothetical protein
MQDKPAAPDLLAAVRTFLHDEILPGLADHRQRFRTLIAMNVLDVVARELAGEEELLRAEWAMLATLDPAAGAGEPPRTLAALRTDIDARKRALCRRIQAGEADAGPWRGAVLAYTRWSVAAKLRVANPGFRARHQSVGQGDASD